jgi:nucleoside-diphosphate-sugar epimerase
VDESVPYLEKSSDNYSFSKMLAEKYVLSQDSDSFKTLALRPHLIWGPKDPHFLPRLQKLSTTKKLKLFSGGPYLIDTTYIDSAVEAHVKAFEKLAAGAPVNGKAYFISQNEPLDVSDFIGLLLKVMDLPPVKPSVPPGLGRAMGSLCETLWKIFNLKEEPPLTKFSAQQLTTHHYFNVGKAKSFLGYGPEKTLKDGLRELALYLKQTKKNLESI